VQVKTFSGSVTLSLPAGSGITYNFETYSGKLSYTGQQSSVGLSNNILSGVIGDGKIPVSVETSTGNFTIQMAE
jgi:DUF4097 and DUF4098 domain-containing protein YvlB